MSRCCFARRGIVLKCVPHVQHAYSSLFAHEIFNLCRCRFTSSMLKLSNNKVSSYRYFLGLVSEISGIWGSFERWTSYIQLVTARIHYTRKEQLFAPKFNLYSFHIVEKDLWSLWRTKNTHYYLFPTICLFCPPKCRKTKLVQKVEIKNDWQTPWKTVTEKQNGG